MIWLALAIPALIFAAWLVFGRLRGRQWSNERRDSYLRLTRWFAVVVLCVYASYVAVGAIYWFQRSACEGWLAAAGAEGYFDKYEGCMIYVDSDVAVKYETWRVVRLEQP